MTDYLEENSLLSLSQESFTKQNDIQKFVKDFQKEVEYKFKKSRTNKNFEFPLQQT